MANCSIPNFSPVSGRISTRSLRRLRRRNNRAAARDALGPTGAAGSSFYRPCNFQRSTLNAQRSIQNVGPWTLDVGRWALDVFFFGRVKGAWWPSRSSKPSSPRKWRGRFDSYPLRFFIFDFQFAIADCYGAARMISIANRNSKIENWGEGR